MGCRTGKKKKAQRGGGASGEKGNNKGLRHFSLKVCQKVEEKGVTTYNEVYQHDPQYMSF